MNRLHGKKALISGASSGIGRSCAVALAREGVDLVVLGRRRERLEELADRVCREYRIHVEPLAVDVRRNADLERLAREHPTCFTGLDILINNAGKAKGLDPLHQGRLEHWEEMIDTNIKGLLYLTRLILPGMVDRKQGHVINIGSVAGHWLYPSGAVYCASKFAVKAINEGMRLDLHGSGVRVTSVDPGLVKTEFAEVRFDGDRVRGAKVYEGMTPLSPDDVAEAVVWCLSRPLHVNVQSLVLFPTDQASVTLVHRRSQESA